MIAKLKNILRCYAVGMGIKETANTFHISRNTVRKYVRLFISSGKTPEQLLEFSEEHLRDIFGCTEFRHREPTQRQLEQDALIPGYVARLSRKGMTVRKLFNEYKSEHPDGFQESINTQREEITAILEQSQQTPVPVERQLTKWEKVKQDIGGMAIGILVAVIAIAVIWLIKKIKR